MNNEPVAELLVNDGEPWGCRYSDEGTLFNADGSRMDGWIPLYIHPPAQQWTIEAKFKELTDEEIYRLLADSIWAVGLNTDCLDEQNWADGITVAKAILRKAQEK